MRRKWVDEESLKRYTKVKAKELFSYMVTWNEFDDVAHKMVGLLESLDPQAMKRVNEYYNLIELYSSAKHYIAILERIVKAIEKGLR